MLEDLGISLNELEKNNFRFVVSQIETAFLKPVEAGSFLTIETDFYIMTMWHKVTLVRHSGTVATPAATTFYFLAKRITIFYPVNRRNPACLVPINST